MKDLSMKSTKVHCQHYALAVVVLTALNTLPMPTAWAQEYSVTQQFNFNIQAQPLTRSVNEIAALAGYAVVILENTKITELGHAVNGRMTVNEALNSLLAGTSFGYRYTNSSTIQLYPVKSSGDESATTLGLITVTQGRDVLEQAPTAVGYVAKTSRSATKTTTSLLETPQTINVVTADEMVALRPQKLAEALRYTPGVITEFQQNTTYFDRTRLRGFYSITNFYFDGMQLTPSGTAAVAQIDPYLLDRMEVIKGPASVLYGQNDAGGIINMSSKHPLSDRKNEIGFRYGSDNFVDTTFDSTGPLTDDGKFLYRIAGIARKADSYIDHAKVERYSIAPSLTWAPSKDTTWTILSGFQDDPAAIASGSLPAAGTILPNINGQIPRNTFVGDPSYDTYSRKQAYVTSEFSHRFNSAMEYRQIVRYMHVDVDAKMISPGALKADQRTVSRTAQTNDAQTNGISLDNNLLYRYTLGNTKNELLAGFDFRRFSYSNRSYSGTSSALDLDVFNPQYGNITLPTMTLRTSGESTLQQYGVYVQNQMSYNRWRLTLGLRNDWTRNDTKNYLTSTRVIQKDHALTGRAGIVYLLDNGLAPYVSYATSFEPTSGTDFYNQAYKPTEGRQWEAGLKYEPSTFNGLFTAALFDLEKRNVTTSDTDHTCANAPTLPNCGSYSIQTGRIDVQGLELEAKISLTEQLDATVGYSLMNAKVKQSNNGDEGKVPTNTPRHMASAWMDYHFADGALSGLAAGAGVRYVGGMYADSLNASKISSYTLFDAMLAFDLKRWWPTLKGTRLSIAATNLTDVDAIGGCLSATSCDYVPARSVIGSINIKF